MDRAFVALYTGASVTAARLVAATGDPDIVAYVAGRLLREPQASEDDPAAVAIDRGRRGALKLIAGGVADASDS